MSRGGLSDNFDDAPIRQFSDEFARGPTLLVTLSVSVSVSVSVLVSGRTVELIAPVMEPFHAKLVAAGSGSMLTALTSGCIIYLFSLSTHFDLSDTF